MSRVCVSAKARSGGAVRGHHGQAAAGQVRGQRLVQQREAGGVQPRVGLVQQPQRLARQHRGGQRQPSALALRQARRRLVGAGLQAPDAQRRAGVDRGRAGDRQRIAQVVGRAQFAAQPVAVRQERHLRIVGGRIAADVAAAPLHAARQRPQQAGQHAQQAGLAAAVGAAHPQQLAGSQRQVDRGRRAAPADQAERAQAGVRRGVGAVRPGAGQGGEGWISGPHAGFPFRSGRAPTTVRRAECWAACGRCPCGSRCRSCSCRPGRSNACSGRARSGA